MAKLGRQDIINQVQSKKPVDYYEETVIRNVYKLAAGITLTVILVVLLIDGIVTHRLNTLVFGIGATLIGSGQLLEGNDYKQTKKIIIGVIWLLIAIIFIAGSFITKLDQV